MESYTFREALFPSAVHRYLKEHKVDFSQLLQEAAVSNGLASDLTFCENRKAASARLVETVGPFWCKSQNEQAILLPLHDKSGLKELKNLLQNAASFFFIVSKICRFQFATSSKFFTYIYPKVGNSNGGSI